MTPRKLYRLGLAMAFAGGMGVAGFAAPALANNGNNGNVPGGGPNSLSHSECSASDTTNCPGGKVPGSEGNVPGDKQIPPGIVGNTNAKGLCSDFATGSSEANNQGRGKSRDGNPAHSCVNTTTTTVTQTVIPPTVVVSGTTTVVSGTTTQVTTTPTTAAPSTSVLGETVTAPSVSSPAAPTASPTAPVAPTAVKKLPFTGPGHVGTLAGIGFSTLLLGGGLLLATRRQPLTVSS